MANFTKLAATAKRLIDKNGRSVTLIKFGASPADDEKPWRGRREYRAAEVTGNGAFVPEGSVETTRSVNPDGVKRNIEYLLFAANDDQGNDIRTFDAVEDGTRIWKIVSVELIAPADTRVLYQIEVTR